LLIIDDERGLVDLLSHYFRKRGFEVITASESKEGLKEALQQKFDAILCDIRMPGLDGRTLYNKLAAIDHKCAQSVVFITGDDMNPETKSFLAKIKNKYFLKPFDLEGLEKVISEISCAFHEDGGASPR